MFGLAITTLGQPRRRWLVLLTKDNVRRICLVYSENLFSVVFSSSFGKEDPGEGALPYLSHMSMCRPKGCGFCDVFGLKTGIDFTHFSLKSGLNF